MSNWYILLIVILVVVGLTTLSLIVFIKYKRYVSLHSSIYSKTCVKRSLLKIPKMAFKIDYHLMQVKSIAECSKESILQYYRPY